MKNEIKLKPCPFCGADAGFFVNNGVRVMCKACGAQTMTLIDNDISANGGAVKRVLDKWNKREELPKEQNATITRAFVMNGFLKCGKCHAIVRRDYKFCPECGTKIDWSRVDALE